MVEVGRVGDRRAVGQGEGLEGHVPVHEKGSDTEGPHGPVDSLVEVIDPVTHVVERVHHTS